MFVRSQVVELTMRQKIVRRGLKGLDYVTRPNQVPRRGQVKMSQTVAVSLLAIAPLKVGVVVEMFQALLTMHGTRFMLLKTTWKERSTFNTQLHFI